MSGAGVFVHGMKRQRVAIVRYRMRMRSRIGEGPRVMLDVVGARPRSNRCGHVVPRRLGAARHPCGALARDYSLNKCAMIFFEELFRIRLRLEPISVLRERRPYRAQGIEERQPSHSMWPIDSHLERDDAAPIVAHYG